MSGVRLTRAVREAIVGHARAARPHECCGLLVGAGGLIDECVPSANVDPLPATRFRLDPAVHVRIIRRLRGTPRTIAGCYHSHPATAALPSPADVAEALYPDFVWVIVSLVDPDEPAVAAFRITAGGCTRLALEVVP